MSQRLFVDGAAGTVGMAIMPHLKQMLKDGLLGEVVMLGDDCRKVRDARLAAMAEADIVLLCLPDDVARDAALMARETNPDLCILDTSAAHRCDDEWEYGMPELVRESALCTAKYVANPGCIATGCILLAQPLSMWHRPDLPKGEPGLPWMAFQAATGYSAGGSKGKASSDMPYLAKLGVAHRHLPEIQRYAKVTPTLTTLVGDWYQGMLVQSSVPVPAAEVYEAYMRAYGEMKHIAVQLAGPEGRRLSAQEKNWTNDVRIVVAEQPFGSVVTAVYDNLGKGSAGAAAHNLRLMLS
ncbi:hypothetical protein AB4Y45_35505 [Paraburkholderia sp. EG287A]|uniref:hypothetical protein n=1 Tax=Paraburkholderia sp. EG287A TaxID=3237012 RepID=UPI0034D1B168